MYKKDAIDNKRIQKLPETVNEPEKELDQWKGVYAVIIRIMQSIIKWSYNCFLPITANDIFIAQNIKYL